MSWKSMTKWVLFDILSWCFQIPSLVQFRKWLLWWKLKLKTEVSHLWKWHQQWYISFFHNVKLSGVHTPWLVIHVNHQLLCALGLLCVCKEKSWACLFNLVPQSTIMFVNIVTKGVVTAFLELIALVHPRSRIATVGGIWFSVWRLWSCSRNANTEKSGSILCFPFSCHLDWCQAHRWMCHKETRGTRWRR